MTGEYRPLCLERLNKEAYIKGEESSWNCSIQSCRNLTCSVETASQTTKAFQSGAGTLSKEGEIKSPVDGTKH